jgi:DNA replication protein DnaC
MARSDAPVLILDDLGTESATVWAREKLFQLINHRYNTGMPMVVTTNHRPEEIDGRILSRLNDRALGPGPIWVEAQDYRSLDDRKRLEAYRRAQALASSAARPQGAGGGRQTRTRS